MEQMVARKSTLKEKMAKLSIVVTKASTRENSGETRNRRKNKGLGDNNILGENFVFENNTLNEGMLNAIQRENSKK